MRGQLQTDVQRAEGLLMTKVIDVNAALAPKSLTLGPKSPKRSAKGGKHKNKGSKGKHTVMTTHQGGPALETHEEAPSTFVRVTVKGEAHCTATIAATTAPRWHASFAFDVDAEESDKIVYEVVSKAGGAEEVVGMRLTGVDVEEGHEIVYKVVSKAGGAAEVVGVNGDIVWEVMSKAGGAAEVGGVVVSNAGGVLEVVGVEVVSEAGGATEVIGVVTIPFGKIWDGAVPLGAPHALLPPGAAAADPLASVGTLYFDCAWAEAPTAPPLVAQPAAVAKSAAAATTTAAAAAAAHLPPPEFGAGAGDLIDWGAAKLAGPRPSVLRVESYYAAAKMVYGTVAHLPLVKMVSPIWEGVLESILQRTPLKPERTPLKAKHGAPEEGAEGHGTRVVDSIDRQIEGALNDVDELVDRKKDEALSSICNAKNVIKLVDKKDETPTSLCNAKNVIKEGRKVGDAQSTVCHANDALKAETLRKVALTSAVDTTHSAASDIRPVETIMTTAGATRGAVGDAVHGAVASVQGFIGGIVDKGFIGGIVDKVHGTAHSAADAVLHAASDATGAAAHAADTVKRAAGAAAGSAVDTVRSTVAPFARAAGAAVGSAVDTVRSTVGAGGAKPATASA
ncbi:hypothetical protein JKP88DRAFT_353644 [Tribonema minus]|uniref:C2 domain-containing protein n=1 Tax=Tribonema minus TaxID=303371 RepID=A0A835Z4Y5_9STRA|nr:hypothetical protein JKP88DRAFT_353644 [Tribonema minus]